MVIPLMIAGAGLGLLVSQLNNYTLAPIEEERVSEAAAVNSAGGSFGLSFGLAFSGAIMLASLSLVFTQETVDTRSERPALSSCVFVCDLIADSSFPLSIPPQPAPNRTRRTATGSKRTSERTGGSLSSARFVRDPA